MKVLIVEDHEHLLKLLVRVMSRYGNYYATDNGADAVRAFEVEMIAKSPFQLVLLDIMMPGMDGYEVLKYIRKIEQIYNHDGLEGAKVVMVTAMNSSHNIMKAFLENCEAYITKPYTGEQVEETLARLGISKPDSKILFKPLHIP